MEGTNARENRYRRVSRRVANRVPLCPAATAVGDTQLPQVRPHMLRTRAPLPLPPPFSQQLVSAPAVPFRRCRRLVNLRLASATRAVSCRRIYIFALVTRLVDWRILCFRETPFSTSGQSCGLLSSVDRTRTTTRERSEGDGKSRRKQRSAVITCTRYEYVIFIQP